MGIFLYCARCGLCWVMTWAANGKCGQSGSARLLCFSGSLSAAWRTSSLPMPKFVSCLRTFLGREVRYSSAVPSSYLGRLVCCTEEHAQQPVLDCSL